MRSHIVANVVDPLGVELRVQQVKLKSIHHSWNTLPSAKKKPQYARRHYGRTHSRQHSRALDTHVHHTRYSRLFFIYGADASTASDMRCCKLEWSAKSSDGCHNRVQSGRTHERTPDWTTQHNTFDAPSLLSEPLAWQIIGYHPHAKPACARIALCRIICILCGELRIIVLFERALHKRNIRAHFLLAPATRLRAGNAYKQINKKCRTLRRRLYGSAVRFHTLWPAAGVWLGVHKREIELSRSIRRRHRKPPIEIERK